MRWLNLLIQRKNYTILALGFAKWRGCDPRALAQSFRAQGHCLIEIDGEDYVPWRWNGFVSRVFRRIFLNSLVEDYNRDILQQAASSAFDFVLVFKGMYLKAETLKVLREYNKPIYNFYPDVSFTDHGSFIPAALRHYDCLFTTKSFHGKRELEFFKVRDMVQVRHGFDPEVHRPVQLSPAQMEYYGCDVSFVGCWSPEKERIITYIRAHRANIKIIVYGIGWKYASSDFKKSMGSNLRPGVFGDELTIVYNASTINLGLLSRAASDPTISDQTTARTFQIPASSSFMLHEDTSEVRSYFEADKEIMVFRSEQELLLKIDYILSNPALRKNIIDNGYRRSLSSPYDYSDAVNKIVHKYQMANG